MSNTNINEANAEHKLLKLSEELIEAIQALSSLDHLEDEWVNASLSFHERYLSLRDACEELTEKGLSLEGCLSKDALHKVDTVGRHGLKIHTQVLELTLEGKTAHGELDSDLQEILNLRLNQIASY